MATVRYRPAVFPEDKDKSRTRRGDSTAQRGVARRDKHDHACIRPRRTSPRSQLAGRWGTGTEGQVHGLSIFAWIILGLLAGAIAKFLLPGRDPGGFIGTTVIGVAGAFIGGWISARWLDHPITKDFYDGATWAAAIGGSLVLLVAYRIIFGHSRD